MKNSILLCILLPVAGFIQSCAGIKKNPFDVNRKIYQPAVDNLQTGFTTYSQVLKAFGEPESVIKAPSGQTLTYSYFGDSLKVVISVDSLVNDYAFVSESFRKTEENPTFYQEGFNTPSFLKKLRKLRPGHSRYDDIVKHLGPPTVMYAGTQRNKLLYQGTDKTLVIYIQKNTGRLIDFFQENK
ncbi:hypothetical protein [Foetidibacter luteolus]|uniref:hypothetical protein n=1 Tax=Foetidibacter luteolus TaxID=2608880 RepID=UPI00129A5B50|nr:hypothetical protein [Foetidibacter luteolus]